MPTANLLFSIKLAMELPPLLGWIIDIPWGPLYKKYGERVCPKIGWYLGAKVAALIQNGLWKWPRRRNRAMREISINTPADFLPDVSKENCVVWSPTAHGSYTMKSAGDAIRCRYDVKDWGFGAR